MSSSRWSGGRWKLRFSADSKSKNVFRSVLEGSDEKLEISNKDAADALIGRLEGASHSVGELRERRQQPRARAPFTTASLQRAASSELSMSPSLTMRVAQQLYEGIAVGGGDPVGLITYMRTDSTQIAAEARTEAKGFIQRRFGDEYVPDKPNTYRTRTRTAQEAHEAVRPTSVYRVPGRNQRRPGYPAIPTLRPDLATVFGQPDGRRPHPHRDRADRYRPPWRDPPTQIPGLRPEGPLRRSPDRLPYREGVRTPKQRRAGRSFSAWRRARLSTSSISPASSTSPNHRRDSPRRVSSGCWKKKELAAPAPTPQPSACWSVITTASLSAGSLSPPSWEKL